jgi:methionyl-tRNA formyltransferase
VASRPRTIFLGSGGFGLPALRALAASPAVALIGVVTAPPRPGGRGRRLTPTPIDEEAERLGVPTVLRPRRLRAPEAVANVLALEPSLLVLADYGQIVPEALLDVPLGALNLHPSLLPRHRGASPIPATILAGDARTGVTLMQMDAGLDTGPIVAAREVGLDGTETAPVLEARLAALGAELLAERLPAWVAGGLEARTQPADGATLTRPLRREDGRLDPDRRVAELERQVRAYQPWPGSWLDSPAGRLTVWAARPRPDAGPGSPGDLVRVDSGLGLAMRDGVLEFLEVQPAGGRRMSGAELVRGRPRLVAG